MRKIVIFCIAAGFIWAFFAVGGTERSSPVPLAYAEKKDENPGKGLGKEKNKDKGQKKGHDKDRGPSVPGIPMAAAVLIGLGAAGAGAYVIKKKKKQ